MRDTNLSNATLKVAIGGVLSLLAGLACQVVTAYLFGAGSEMDAFFTAYTIPTYLQIVFLSGLPFVVIPAFVNEEASGREEDAWAIAGAFIWLAGGLLLAIAVAGALFSTQMIAVTAPGFGFAKSALASRMLAVLMFTVPFFGMGTFTSGIENVRGRFFWPATATAVGSLGNLLTLLLFYSLLGPMALAWGSLVSAILFAAVTTVPVLMHGWKKVISLKDPRLIEMLKLTAPFIFFGLITNGKMILERFFASGLSHGQLSYIGYAGKISNIFVILFATSIASAIFPVMARAYATIGINGLVKQADFGMRVTLALALPAVTISTIVAVPLVRVFYERGAFVPATTFSVSLLIPIVMINDVLFRMVNNMIGRTFFVLKDTLTTNLISSLTILVYFIAAQFLTQRWGYIGLALAQPIQAGLAILLSGMLLYRRVKEFSVLGMAKSFLSYTLASLAAALIAWLVMQLTSGAAAVVQLTAGIFLAGIAYLALLYWIDPTIAMSLFDMAGLPKIYSAVKTRVTKAHETSAP